RLRRDCSIPHKLVLAGGEGWQTSPLFAEVEALGVQDLVLFPGYVDPGDQVLWYNAADAFVYPSLYEGFGLPPLEALACGVPVITSDRASLPEVVGTAGLLANPEDPQAMAHAIAAVLTDPDRHASMSQLGQERARRFTWGRMAREMLHLYRSLTPAAQAR